MAKCTGNNGQVMVGAVAVVNVQRWTLNRNADRLDASVMGEANKTYMAGDVDVDGTFDCLYDKADASQESLIPGAIVTLKLRPQGPGSGLAEYTISATILRQTIEAARNAINTRTYEWGAAGDLTEGVQA